MWLLTTFYQYDRHVEQSGALWRVVDIAQLHINIYLYISIVFTTELIAIFSPDKL
jgi:hypothetical protein